MTHENWCCSQVPQVAQPHNSHKIWQHTVGHQVLIHSTSFGHRDDDKRRRMDGIGKKMRYWRRKYKCSCTSCTESPSLSLLSPFFHLSPSLVCLPAPERVVLLVTSPGVQTTESIGPLHVRP
uniref:Uncharacterized protein LOC101291673 n=2 Tax=Rhizophora mucronata TaxID=61149 RepID=A0A2P2L2L5_RHIMU